MLSMLMLGALGLIGGAILLWRRRGFSRNVWLMLVAAAVMLADVATWVVPGPNGASPMNAASGPG
jgi:hypothetical protein